MSQNFLQAIQRLKYDWPKQARPSQLAPPEFASGQKRNWLIVTGRGWGKNRTGSELVRQWAKHYDRVNLIGPTHDSVRDIMVLGESGLLAVCPKSERPRFVPSRHIVEWQNGGQTLLFSAEEPERLRGPQHSKLFCDELGAWKYQDETWDMAMFGLRLGSNPQCLVTTTPRPTKLVKMLLTDPNTVVTRGTTYENRANLAAGFFSHISRYEGNRLGKQEILGEVLEDREGALFFQAQIDSARVATKPAELIRIVVGVDPAVGGPDECGIVVVGKDARRPPHFFVLDDLSMPGSPDRWARRVVAAYHKHSADVVVGEVNMGGDLIAATIHNVDSTIPFKAVRATRGKLIRAEPASLLVESGRVHFVGSFGQLEDQLTDWTAESGGSPDRMDAFVWGLHEVSQGSDGWQGGWVAEASAIFKETGTNPLAVETSKPSTAGEAQMAAQDGVVKFKRNKHVFGDLETSAMTNGRVKDYRTPAPKECGSCGNKVISIYDGYSRCACGWDSRTPVAATPPPVVVPEKPKEKPGLLDFRLARLGL